MRDREGFTLIELLVAIAIVAVLAGMAMPMVSMARKMAATRNTQSLLSKVETALGLFKADMSVYPYQDHPAASVFPAEDNRLLWVLGHTLTATERTDLDDDLRKARAAYAVGGAHEILAADLQSGYSVTTTPLAMLNRMATERATLGIISGNTGIKGIRNKPGSTIINGAKSRGFADDYLAGDLTASERKGTAIYDHYRQPLMYICPVVPGMRRLTPADSLRQIDVLYYGMVATGRQATAIAASDMRSTAPPRWRFRYELISKGADGRIDPQRDHADNRDNHVLGTVRGELK